MERKRSRENATGSPLSTFDYLGLRLYATSFNLVVVELVISHHLSPVQRPSDTQNDNSSEKFRFCENRIRRIVKCPAEYVWGKNRRTSNFACVHIAGLRYTYVFTTLFAEKFHENTRKLRENVV